MLKALMTFENVTFKEFSLCVCLLVFKILLLLLLEFIQRMRYKKFIAIEDEYNLLFLYRYFNNNDKDTIQKQVLHRLELSIKKSYEYFILFFIIGLLTVYSNLHILRGQFYIFTIAQYLYDCFFIILCKQPYRTIMWFIQFIILLNMSFILIFEILTF